MARVVQKMTRLSAEHLKPWNLSVAQFDAIAQIGSTERLAQQDLADRLLVTKGNVSQLVDRLEQRGIVGRCHEGRTQRLSLTAAGRQLYNEVVPAHERFIARQFATLCPEEQQHLRRLLRHIDQQCAWRKEA